MEATSALNTAKLMDENTMLFKLKEIECVEKIADKINSILLSEATRSLISEGYLRTEEAAIKTVTLKAALASADGNGPMA